MQEIASVECSRIAQDLQIRKSQVEAVVHLLQEGNTVPFITRYRKERTGGLNEDVIRHIQRRVQQLHQLHDRKQTILKTIEAQGKLTPELHDAIEKADTTRRLEDLYLPFKPKKKSLAAAAREKGLEPLAWAVWTSDYAVGNLDELAASMLNPEKGLNSVDDVKLGVQHVIAEWMAESTDVRAPVRSLMWESGKLTSHKNEKLAEGQGGEFKDYFQYSEGVRQAPAHRILAINRAEREGAIKVKFEWPLERIQEAALAGAAEVLLRTVGKPFPTISSTQSPPPAPAAEETVSSAEPNLEGAAPATDPHAGECTRAADPCAVQTPSEGQLAGESAPSEPASVESAPSESSTPEAGSPGLAPEAPAIALQGETLAPNAEFKSPYAEFLKTCLNDALTRLVVPSLEREIKSELTDDAEMHAVTVFGRNLRSLLLQPPLHGKRVLAIDPGYRTGCKVVALDEIGNVLEHSVIHPFAPPPRKGREKKESKKKEAAKAAEAAAAGATPAPDASPAPEGNPSLPPETSTPAEAHAEAPPNTATPDAVAPVADPSASAETATAPVESTSSPEAATNAETPPEGTTAPASESAEPAAPTPDRKAESREALKALVEKHNIQVVALGNGSGCRETEEIVAELIGSSTPDMGYVIVNEAGASVYSVSEVAREEFPEYDATVRGAVSIGRRLQDPLSELVKIEPQSIGVGLYQHDMGKKDLRESLEGVVESCVNQVGVDVNTASVPLLRYIAGLNQLVGREIVEYRKQHGPFRSRADLINVPGLGVARFQQSAGFLKIPEASNPLDRTWIHPESYEAAERLLAELGFAPAVLDDKSAAAELHAKLAAVNVAEMAQTLGIGVPTLTDIIENLKKPGRDPREELPPPTFKRGILKLDDLQPGMELKGTVLNVVDFGAFVDIGLKDSGLVHISQMANRYIKSPYDVVSVNDVVAVWVLSIDRERGRVSLTMIQPGTERKAPERRGGPGGERRERGPRRPEGEASQRPPRREGDSGRGRGGPGRGDQPQTAEGAPAAAGHGDSRDRRGGPGGRGSPQGGRGAQHGGGHSGGDQRGGPPGRGGPPRRGGPPGRGQQRGAPRSAPLPPAQQQRGGSSLLSGSPGVTGVESSSGPRKSRRDSTPAVLSQDAKAGKAPLRTFGELSAFFRTKKDGDEPTPPSESAPHAESSSASNSPPSASPEQTGGEPHGHDSAPPPGVEGGS